MGPFILHGCRWLHESQPPPDHGVHLPGDRLSTPWGPVSSGESPFTSPIRWSCRYVEGFLIGGCEPSSGAAEPTATLWLCHEGKISPRARHGLPPTGPRAGESPPATNAIPEKLGVRSWIKKIKKNDPSYLQGVFRLEVLPFGQLPEYSRVLPGSLCYPSWVLVTLHTRRVLRDRVPGWVLVGTWVPGVNECSGTRVPVDLPSKCRTWQIITP